MAPHVIIEGKYPFGLRVSLVAGRPLQTRLLRELTSPEGIVSEDEAARSHPRQERVDILHVVTLVGVDKRQVPAAVERGKHGQRIPDVDMDIRGTRRRGDVSPKGILHLVIGLNGVELPSGGIPSASDMAEYPVNAPNSTT